ncbi:ferric reductase-like transmembrane domain-containing protein [Candidatus Woesearchaeota archaeon]|nr:ferric reductase-like transmembrane domain-containing protein [Candidatus Woesearchaeota archaeon]
MDKLKKKRYVLIGLFATILIYAFYLSRPELASTHRIWRATGDASFVLLFLTLIIGPLSKLWRKTMILIPWRRQLGVWFTLVAILHTVLIFDGWLLWSVNKFLGYEFVSQLNAVVLVQPGFGLANILGLVSLFFGVVLLSVSSDRAIRYLGGNSWKYLQSFAYVIFYLGSFHAIYFAFFHFNQAMYYGRELNNWFSYYILILFFTLVFVQIMSFIKTFKLRKRT